MAGRVLENVNMGCTWSSYMSGTDGALRASGMWSDEVYMLMGMTGMAFHFIVHKSACPSSVTVYDWVNEHSMMMDRIGVHSDVYQVCYDSRLNTYEQKRKDAVQRIKESIDRGIGVVIWAPTRILEFGLVYGYDDEDGVFFVKDCTGQPADPLLYENLGKSDVPMLSYQIIKEKKAVDPEKTYRDSLQFAVNEWNKEFHVNPEYASGRKAYDSLVSTLEKGDFDNFGLAYILAVYSDSKDCIARYIEFLTGASKEIKGLEKAGVLYRQIAEKYKAMTALYPFSGENGVGCKADRKNAPEILKLVKECRELEDKAIAVISSALK